MKTFAFILFLCMITLSACYSTNHNLKPQEKNLVYVNSDDDSFCHAQICDNDKAYEIQTNDDTELMRIVQAFYNWDYSIMYGGSSPQKYRAKIFGAFRYSIETFLNAAAITTAYSRLMAIHSIAIDIALAESVDPLLFLELLELLTYANNLDLNESEAMVLQDIHLELQQETARRNSFTHLKRIDTMFDHIPYWYDDFDWWRQRNIGGTPGAIMDGIEDDFRYYFGEPRSLSLLSLIRYDSNNPLMEPLRIIGALESDIRDKVIYFLANRISAIRDADFNIYQEYFEILTNPIFIFDSRSGELFKQINYLMRNLRQS